MAHENLMIMDSAVTKITKKRHFKISRTIAIALLLVFLLSLVLTGVLVYNLTPCCTLTNLEPVKVCKTAPTTAAGTIFPTPSTAITKIASQSTRTTTQRPKPSENATEPNLRLPRSIRPVSYRLKLTPFVFEGNFTFDGEVVIRLNVLEPCKNITLHATDLNIAKVSVLEIGNRHISIQRIENDTEKDFLIVHLNEQLRVEKEYLIYIDYTGVLNDLLKGFYRSSYMENNQTRWLAVTQFQPTDARRAFPCFDEPTMKAKFKIRIARWKNMTSISNMPRTSVQKHEFDSNYVWDNYEESVPMSTYLVAFLVSDFQNISNGMFSIWARPSALSQAKYSLKIGPIILKFYERFFGIKYPLPKVDMAAIPDFPAGAMENWGLVTFRETALLYEEGVSDRSSMRTIDRVVAHELAHQWFGNLVTPEWWSDLWLNEGFASFVENLGADEVNPLWKNSDLSITALQTSFKLDVLETSHQICVNVTNPDEVNEIFDEISYAKSASIIRMMEQFLSPSVFKLGLKKYLKERAFGNAEQDDLWEVLTAQSHFDGVLPTNLTINEIMDTWTLQVGFPVVNVERDYTKNSIKLKQERFMLTKKNSTNLWWIPITFTDSSGQLTRVWMSKHENELILTNISTESDDWLLMNVNQTGYYRVNYDLNNWALIIDQLHKPNGHLVFDVKNRAQIIDDALNLAFSGDITYELALNLTSYIKQEKEFLPIDRAVRNLMILEGMFQQTAHFDKFKSFMLDLIANYYREVSFKSNKNEDPLQYLTRLSILNVACKLGLRDCVINAVQMFQNWKNTANPDSENGIAPDVRVIVYCTAIRDGGQEEWDFAWQRYLNTNVASEQDVLLTNLACSREPWILRRYLEWAFTNQSESGIRKHDAAAVFVYVAINPVGRQLAFAFLKENWDRIRQYMGPSSASLAELFTGAALEMNSKSEIDDYKNFVKSKEDELVFAHRTIEQSIENAEANMNWMENNFKEIVNWLVKYSTR